MSMFIPEFTFAFFQIVDLLDVGSSIDLELDPVSSPVPEVTCFLQKNSKASRKKVLPIIKSFLHGARTPDVTNKDFLSTESVSMAVEGFTSYITPTDPEKGVDFGSSENPTILLDKASEDVNFDEIDNVVIDNEDTDRSNNIHNVQASVTVIEKFIDNTPIIHPDNQLTEENSTRRKIPFDPFRNVVSSSDLTSYSSSNNPYDFVTSLSGELIDPFSSVEEPNQTNTDNIPFATDAKIDTNPFLSELENLTQDPITPRGIDSETKLILTENVTQSLWDTGQSKNPFISEGDNLRQLNMNENQPGDMESTGEASSNPTVNPFEGFENFNTDVSDLTSLETGQKSIDGILVSGSFEERSYQLRQYIEDPNPFLTSTDYSENTEGENETDPNVNLEFGSGGYAMNINVVPPCNNDSENDDQAKADDDILDASDKDVNTEDGNSEPFLDALGREYLAARPKARKSISLIVEVENTDSLADLTEADFYDKIQTPSPGQQTPSPIQSGSNSPFICHSGSNSPFVNSGLSTPFESVSAFHSLRTSVSDSGYPSITETPPNSMVEGAYAGNRDFNLPSFNNAEMVAKIQRKKASLGGGVDLLGLIPEPTDTTPYTPRNSFREESEKNSPDEELNLPNLSNSAILQRVQEKRCSLSIAMESTSAEVLDFEEVKRDNNVPTFDSVGFDPFRGKVNSPNFDDENFDPFGPQSRIVNAKVDSFESDGFSDKTSLECLVEVDSFDQNSASLDDPFGLNTQTRERSKTENCPSNKLFPDDRARNLFTDLGPFTPENSFVETKGQVMEGRKSITDDKLLLDKLMNLKEEMSVENNGESLVDMENETLGIENGISVLQESERKEKTSDTEVPQNLIDIDFSFSGVNTNNMKQDNIFSSDMEYMSEATTENDNENSPDKTVSKSNMDGKLPAVNGIDRILTDFDPAITDKATEEALYEVATAFAKEVISDAIERFPEVRNPAVADAVAMEIFEGDNSQWLRQISQDSLSSGSQGMMILR